jgi:hypothetical protein
MAAEVDGAAAAPAEGAAPNEEIKPYKIHVSVPAPRSNDLPKIDLPARVCG